MNRYPHVNYDSPATSTNRSMFLRPLSAAASAPAHTVARTPWHSQAGHSWWWWTLRSPSAPARPRCPEPSAWRSLSASRRTPLDAFSWSEWRRPGLLPQQASAVMEHPETEPPLKRRRSAEDAGCRASPSPSPSSSRGPAWLQNVIGVPIPAGTFPPSPENTRNLRELQRHWENLTPSCRPRAAKAACGQPFDFSVMSYNILSQELLLGNSYLYKHCNPLILEWRHRFRNIIKELEHHGADIMCLQEVQEDHYERQIKPHLETLGYHCEYKRRTGRKPDGCAVAFKRDRFSLLSCHPVEYFCRGIPLLDRDNVGLILLLQPTELSGTASSICVANTHLLYNPRRGDIKLAQLAMLLAEISRVSRQADGANCPVVLCGDFNSVPSSPLYNFIKESRLEYAGMPVGKVSGQEEGSRGQRMLPVPIWPPNLGISQQCQYKSQDEVTSTEPNREKLEQQALAALNSLDKPRIEHGLKLTSAYSHYLKESGRAEISTCHSRTAITVDYIFYSPAGEDKSAQTGCSTSAEQGLQLLARLALVGETELVEVNGLPNQHNSSDHLPLIAKFRLHS